MRRAIPSPGISRTAALCFIAVDDERVAAEAWAAAKGAGA